MKKVLFLSGIALLALLACNRSVLKDKLFLRGRLLLVDTITQNSMNVPLSKQTINLANLSSDTLNYAFSTTTDTAGYFTFSLLDDGTQKFTVRYDGLIGSYHYTGMDTVNKGDQNILLYAKLNESIQNGFAMRTIDNSTPAFPLQSFPNVTVRLYNDGTLASIDNPGGALQVVQTDSLGKFFKFNIPAGIYYFNATKTVGTNTWQRMMKQVTIGSTGILKDTIILTQLVFANKLMINVIDSTNGIIPGAAIYVYNSQVLAASNDPTGAVIVSSTDSVGGFSATNLPVGNYFINATKKVDTVTYQSIGNKFALAASGITSGVIVVHKK